MTRRRFWAPAVLAVAGLLLTACSSDEDEERRNVRGKLMGTRISVLSFEQSVTPDVAPGEVNITIPAPRRPDAWPVAGGTPHHVVEHLSISGFREAYDVDVGEGTWKRNRMLATPVVADGVVITMDAEAEVRAWRAADGRALWEVDLTPENADELAQRGGGLALADGKIIATTGFGHVVALAFDSGQELWRTDRGVPLRAPPTMDGNRVVAVTVDNQVFALNVADGSPVWSFSGITEESTLVGAPAPAVSETAVVAGLSSGELVALRRETGSVLWSDSLTATRRADPISNMATIGGRTVIQGDVVYAIGHSGLMVAVDLRTGKRLWERELAGLQQPWIAGNMIYVVTIDAQVVALEAATGRIVWIRALQRYEDMDDREEPIAWVGPILVNGRLLVAGSHGAMLVLSPYDGRVFGWEDMGDGVSLSPVSADGTLYVVTDDGRLMALR